ncbi:MAG: aminoacetone oxidase family FAD-binding enzyme, partial [Alphaproteobacteria bacterium]|nr:aminoacetone oxidase family FAD-binding enzyme [Alphaproteobacteria bacterium]
FVALVRKHGIAFHEKTLGQLFCDGSARAIVRMLLDECAAAGVELRLGQRIGAVTRADAFSVETPRGLVCAPALVLATGGLSIPKMGATDFSLRVARQFGLPLVAPRPALVPLTFDGALLELMQPLAGVSLPITAAIGKRRFEEAMLFTHRGLSGPAILQISSYWQGGDVALSLMPDGAAALLRAKREQPRIQPQTALGAFLPARLAQALAAAHLPARPMADVPDRALSALGDMLCNWRVTPAGTEGYVKAEVMAGGVDTQAMQQRDCQARDVPGLFVVGEAVDVTGWLGGYNFQWAWASGWVAGDSA